MMSPDVNCNLCNKPVSSGAVAYFSDLFANNLTVAETLAQFAGIEITPYPTLNEAFICLQDCYQRLLTCITFQDTIGKMFENLIAEASESIDRIESKAEELVLKLESEDKAPTENNQTTKLGRPFTIPSNMAYVKIHMKFDNLEYVQLNGLMCCGCDFIGITANELLEHVSETHRQELFTPTAPFVCDLCYEPLEDEHRLRLHRQWFQNAEIFLCKFCSHGFLTKEMLVQHMSECIVEIVEENNHAECMESQYVNMPETAVQYLDESVKEQHFHKYTKVSKNLDHEALKSPQKKSIQLNGYGCCFLRCNATFDGEKDLNNHVQQMHIARRRIHKSERTSDQYVCGTCELSFKSEKALQQHRVSWRQKQKNACSQCGKGFVRGRDLREHEQLQHNDTPAQFVCEVCGKGFKKKSLVRLHLVTHQQDRRYGCEQCGARFHFGYRLRKHLQAVHTTQYPYECAYCDQKLADKNRYDLHLRQHTGEKPYGCRHGCGRMFAHSTDRRRHEMVVHTGEKPHRCAGCGVGYVRKRCLLLHYQKNPEHDVDSTSQVRIDGSPAAS